MTSGEWIDLLRLIPADQHSQLVLLLDGGLEIGIEVIIRQEPSYVAFRGRALGSTEEGRVFFVPFERIVYLLVNRWVKEQEIHDLYIASTSEPAPETAKPGTSSGTVPRIPAAPASPIPPVPATADPKGSILERLRAQRTPRPK